MLNSGGNIPTVDFLQTSEASIEMDKKRFNRIDRALATITVVLNLALVVFINTFFYYQENNKLIRAGFLGGSLLASFVFLFVFAVTFILGKDARNPAFRLGLLLIAQLLNAVVCCAVGVFFSVDSIDKTGITNWGNLMIMIAIGLMLLFAGIAHYIWFCRKSQSMCQTMCQAMCSRTLPFRRYRSIELTDPDYLSQTTDLTGSYRFLPEKESSLDDVSYHLGVAQAAAAVRASKAATMNITPAAAATERFASVVATDVVSSAIRSIADKTTGSSAVMTEGSVSYKTINQNVTITQQQQALPNIDRYQFRPINTFLHSGETKAIIEAPPKHILQESTSSTLPPAVIRELSSRVSRGRVPTPSEALDSADSGQKEKIPDKKIHTRRRGNQMEDKRNIFMTEMLHKPSHRPSTKEHIYSNMETIINQRNSELCGSDSEVGLYSSKSCQTDISVDPSAITRRKKKLPLPSSTLSNIKEVPCEMDVSFQLPNVPITADTSEESDCIQKKPHKD